MPGVLDGVRVVDFGQYIAGPLAAMILADNGAEVVRINPPSGPRWDTPANLVWNRGKRSLALDLKTAEGVKVAQALIADADIVIENFRPGVMERLGVGPNRMTSENPRLIYVSLPGFGTNDPRSSIAGWEGVVGAASRMYPISPKTKRPVYTAIPISSCFAAFQGATATVMALLARDRDGLGQKIEVPLFDASLTAIGWRASRVDGAFRQLKNPAIVERWSKEFRARDGRWVSHVALNKRFRAFLDASGAAPWADDDDSSPKIVSMFNERDAQSWEDLAHEVGSEAAACLTGPEWLGNAHALECGIVVESNHPAVGSLRQPGLHLRLATTPGSVGSPEQPSEVKGIDWAPRPAAVPAATPREAGDGPLAGVRVIDLCTNLAGPTSGRTLAEYGADVIKVNNRNAESVSSNNDVNRAKRSILLDLKSEGGLEVFWRLIDGADVVVQNFRKGVAERLGIGYEQVRQRRPDIVFGYLNTYGQEGPWAGRPGHEPLAQAVTGMMERFGDGEPVRHTYAIDDYASGINLACAVGMALLHRQRTGEGQFVNTALSYTATVLQSQFLQQFDGKVWDEPRGQDLLGPSTLQRAYLAADGWVFLGARTTDLPALETVLGIDGLVGCAPDALAPRLEGAFATRSVVELSDALCAAGIAAHPVVDDLAQLMDDRWMCDVGLSMTRDHIGVGSVTTVGPAPKLSRTPVTAGIAAVPPGWNTEEILDEIGLGADAASLIASGAVATGGVGAP